MAEHTDRCEDIGGLLALTTEQIRIVMDTHGYDSELREYLGQAAAGLSWAQACTHRDCLNVRS